MIRMISFEGGDGSGKTTQINLLERHLTIQGISCLLTREPGRTTLGQLIRKVVLEGAEEEIAYQTELFLYLADRAEH
ncbi:MAG: dTMP kinase, partial [Candidatus Binatia bacterium]